MQIRQTVVTALDNAAFAELVGIAPNLVLTFAAPKFFTDPAFAPWLAAAFPQARRIALSTAGEISSQGVTDDCVVVTAVRFENTPFRIASTPIADMDDSEGAGRRLAEQLRDPDLKAVILLSQGVAVNGSELIAGVVSVLGKGVPLTGGLAGDNGAFTRTWAMLDDQVSDRLMLAVGLYGDAISFAHGSFGGWQSFGPARRVTRAVGNVLYELDGEPALDIYKRYLGEYAKDLPASGLLFPFAILSQEREEVGLIRTLLGINEADGSLTLAGDIPQDGHLRLMHASSDALVDGAEAAAEAARRMYGANGQGLALLVSCIGRKLVMGDRVDEEVEAVGAVFGQNCVLTGFYSNGEISPFLETTECKLHNQTMTITYLGER
ncbi:MAG: FIST C-terminal domain-containing protein [Betaproteobacteria bacterium]|nr:FIST C-terminal domain-containing protein [Betaproteobacteria bacterium]